MASCIIIKDASSVTLLLNHVLLYKNTASVTSSLHHASNYVYVNIFSNILGQLYLSHVHISELHHTVRSILRLAQPVRVHDGVHVQSLRPGHPQQQHHDGGE